MEFRRQLFDQNRIKFEKSPCVTTTREKTQSFTQVATFKDLQRRLTIAFLGYARQSAANRNARKICRDELQRRGRFSQ